MSNPFGVQVLPKADSASKLFPFVFVVGLNKPELMLIYRDHKLHFMQDMLLRFCCAMLLGVKSRLLSGDFAANLKLLQHYPDINIEHLLQEARDLSPDTSSYRLSP